MPVLIVPVESQVRELDAKLLLACAAAERGFTVILGSRTYVNFAMPFLERGVFLAKSLRSISKLMLNFIVDLGHQVVAWDEESLVRFSSPEYYPWRYSEETFRALRHLFAWGPDDAAFFKGYSGYPGTPIHVTGNPRIDLLRREMREFFSEDAARLRSQYGDFILINTNFSFVNNFVPALNLMQPAGAGERSEVSRAGRGLSWEFAQGMAAHQGIICEYFRMLMPRLAQWFPNRQIILRPHPSENHEFWKSLLSTYGNVHVLHEGNVVPWLMACRVLIHNGCTTAVEAAMLNCPAITFQPVMSASYDYRLPNSLSHVATTVDEVLAIADDVLNGTTGPLDESIRQGIFAQHLEGTTGRLSVDRCVDVLEAAGYARDPLPRPRRARHAVAWVGANLRTLVKRVNRLRPGHRNSAAYHDHRFPGISAAQINERIARFGRLLGRFAQVSAEPVSPHIFRIRPGQEGPWT